MFLEDILKDGFVNYKKSHKAKRFKALKKVRPMVRRIVGLTGTPASNGLIDLWAEIGILDMGQRLGRFIGGYRERFFVPDKRSREMVFSYKPREGAEDMIYNLISDICISMKAVDYLDMPECVYNRVEVILSEKEMALYEQLERDMLLPFSDGDIDAVNAAALSNKLLQMQALLERASVVTDMNRKENLFQYKVGAAITAARRGGALNALDAMNHFFMLQNMFIVGSTYWPMAYGQMPGDVQKDEEGLATMSNLG